MKYFLILAALFSSLHFFASQPDDTPATVAKQLKRPGTIARKSRSAADELRYRNYGPPIPPPLFNLDPIPVETRPFRAHVYFPALSTIDIDARFAQLRNQRLAAIQRQNAEALPSAPVRREREQ